MDQEIICIDAKFTPEQLEFWAYHKVVHPEQDKMYNIREFIKNSEGNAGFLLDEIKNPKIPIMHPILGVTMIEPYWNYKRFAHLNGIPLSIEEVKEWDKQEQLLKNFNF